MEIGILILAAISASLLIHAWITGDFKEAKESFLCIQRGRLHKRPERWGR